MNLYHLELPSKTAAVGLSLPPSVNPYLVLKLNIKSNEVLVSANNPEQEEGVESFKSKYDGDDVEIAFNVNYIQEVLSNIDSSDCNINLYGSDKSCLISPSDDPNLKYVVMPLLI